MTTQKNNNDSTRSDVGNNAERKSSVANDLPDTDRDRLELKSEEIIMDLPDVKDIPGQEFIHAPNFGEMADVTISSADEEGENIEGLNDDDGDVDNDTASNGNSIGHDESIGLADDNYMPTKDEDALRQARMDNADYDGDELNEGSFGIVETSSDLDVPGNTGDYGSKGNVNASDEENKSFSVDDTDESEPSENRTGA